jgi:iron complex transport system ATP-binding protein
MLKSFEQNNISVGGIYSPRVKENDITIGYDIVDINNNKTEIFLREKGNKNLEKIGKFHIFNEGLATGKNALNLNNIMNNKIIIIDEVGKLELENNGWAYAINDLFHHAKHHIILVVRNQFVKDVIDKWHIEEYTLYDIANHNSMEINNDIIKQITL